MPKIYLIAGEASGDLHAALLMQSLQKEIPDCDFRYWGGDKMAAVGGTLVRHYRDLAFMGFWEVVKNLRTIFRNLDDCFADIARFQPDVLILVDYSGFNLRIAAKAKKAGLRVFYYISPQIWASREGRIRKIKAYVDEMFVILPFEEAFYAKHDFPVHYIGHPLLDVVRDFTPDSAFPQENELSDAPIIALLPGSRRQEIRMMLREMLGVVSHFSAYQFIIAGAPNIPSELYAEIIAAAGSPASVRLIHGATYEILARAEAALVTSGTATLEAALFDVPQVVCYKGGAISYAVAKRIIKVKYISLVNLITDREVVRELIQNDMRADNLRRELGDILEGKKRQEILDTYKKLRHRLGESDAPARAARIMRHKLQQSQQVQGDSGA